MGTRAPRYSHPCRATNVVTMVSNVIPCKGSRGWAMECGWFMDEVDLSGGRVPITAEFHKWVPWQDRSGIEDQNVGQWGQESIQEHTRE